MSLFPRNHTSKFLCVDKLNDQYIITGGLDQVIVYNIEDSNDFHEYELEGHIITDFCVDRREEMIIVFMASSTSFLPVMTIIDNKINEAKFNYLAFYDSVAIEMYKGNFFIATRYADERTQSINTSHNQIAMIYLDTDPENYKVVKQVNIIDHKNKAWITNMKFIKKSETLLVSTTSPNITLYSRILERIGIIDNNHLEFKEIGLESKFEQFPRIITEDEINQRTMIANETLGSISIFSNKKTSFQYLRSLHINKFAINSIIKNGVIADCYISDMICWEDLILIGIDDGTISIWCTKCSIKFAEVKFQRQELLIGKEIHNVRMVVVKSKCIAVNRYGEILSFDLSLLNHDHRV
ncbi:predicted protein [Candida tropicalis MYA-3404]|uniref:Uncharacterized protein n=1 Tax=Candida tropicalis (strain ATCC MYA-3404 / T1) TaxID=294747 RepID=C5M476_CANTT|nr:predicted protein [Candida tropicalis MYA-3404]EER36126.1 predicted protein [Candida tropicalis MYA-3404]KAG4410245.1 hypothetical protein JTP64_000883 [Candida tropicalis]MCP8716632.1 hypothetical protein [Asgard group archaeon]